MINIGAIAVIIAVELGLVMRWRQSENVGAKSMSLKEKILKRLEAMDEEACIWKFINAWLLDPEEEDE